MKHLKTTLLILLLFLVSSCGLSSQEENPSLEQYESSRGENLQLKEDEWYGSGKVLMKSSLRSLREDMHLAVNGQFLESESFFILHLYFDNFQYDTGLQLRFKQDLQDPENALITVELAEPGLSFRPMGEISGALDKNGYFDLRVELHNQSHFDRKILVWNDSILMDSSSRKNRQQLIEGNADYNSSLADFVVYNWGQGLKWGVAIDRMRLVELKREVPFVD